MLELQINTTQNVNINFKAAGVGERIMAYGIDWVIKIAYIVVVYQIGFNLFNANILMGSMDDWSKIAIYISFCLPVILYSFLFETLLDGQTIGKRVLKIKVVKIDGYQATLVDFLIRWFFRIVDLNMMTGVVALIAIITSNKNQRLGDITAGTAVIALKDEININHTILENLEQDYKPTYPNVIKLSDNDTRIIKDTFTMARAAKDYHTLIKLRNKLIEVIELKEMKHTTDIEFIEVILKDYNYYTQNM